MTDTWIKVAESGRLAAGRPLPVYPQGLALLLVRVDDVVYAIANRCAHMACPLEAGPLDGHLLTCPCHDWRFDVRTGVSADAPEIFIATYPARTNDGVIYVDLAEALS